MELAFHPCQWPVFYKMILSSPVRQVFLYTKAEWMLQVAENEEFSRLFFSIFLNLNVQNSFIFAALKQLYKSLFFF